MKSENREQIQKAFTQQAAGFESGRMSFSKQEYLDYAVSRVAPRQTDDVLEVAAGTCACARAFASHVASVTCLDMTAAMLKVGEEAARRQGLHGMRFVLGDAAELPFEAEAFDVVFSRLAFHHFPEPTRPFAEMVRVLRPGGKLVLIDMEAAQEDLRAAEDALEKLRDPSHVRSLSRAEMLALYEAHGLSVEACEVVRMPVHLDAAYRYPARRAEPDLPADGRGAFRRREDRLFALSPGGRDPVRPEMDAVYRQEAARGCLN